MSRRHVIIGMGPAGVAAAEGIRAEDADATISIISSDPHGYYSRPGLAYLLTREMPQAGLVPFSEEDFVRLGVERIPGTVTGIDLTRRRVMLASGREHPYDRLLVAAGSRSTPAKAPGGDLDGVVKLDDMADALDMIDRCSGGRSAVVVGGGITALEIVEGLRARKLQTHYFLRRERFWANVLSDEESDLVLDGLHRDGVLVHRNTELARIVGANGHVVAVETTDSERIPCDMVAVAIGVLPQVQLARDAGLECQRGIAVDRHLQTTDELVYAAGDVAEVCDPRTGKGTLHVLWNAAVEKGRAAGHNMALTALGQEPQHIYRTANPMNITRLAGLHTTIIGTVGRGGDADLQSLSRGDSQVWSELTEATIVEAGSKEEHVRLALGGGVIAGAVVMGDQTLSFPLQDLIERRVDVSHIREHLAAPAAPLSELIHGVWEDSETKR